MLQLVGPGAALSVAVGNQAKPHLGKEALEMAQGLDLRDQMGVANRCWGKSRPANRDDLLGIRDAWN